MGAMPAPTGGVVRARRSSTLPASVVAFAALSLAGVPLSAPAALAHVSAEPSSTAAGSSTTVTLSVSHGCDGSPTTRLDVSIPEGVNAVTPTVVAGWRIKKVTSALDEPITDAHGSTLTERVSEVIYTAREPLPEGYRATFDLSLTIPETMAGEALAFPTVQTCAQGKTAWIQRPEGGRSEDDLEEPAPAFLVTAADGTGSRGGAAEPAEPAARAAPVQTARPTTRAVSWVALGLGAVGAVLGGLGFARSRRG
jgi:uncharacterized protein YcnI